MPKPIPFPWPYKGLNHDWPENAQPALSTPDAQNVMTDEPQRQRARGGSRAGTVKAIATQLGDGTSRRVTGLAQVTTQIIDEGTADSGGGGGGSGFYQTITNADSYGGLRNGATRAGFETEFTGWDVGTTNTVGDALATYVGLIGNGTRGGSFDEIPMSVGDFSDSRGDGVAFFADDTSHGTCCAWRGGNYTNSDELELELIGIPLIDAGDVFISARVDGDDPTSTGGVITLRSQFDSGTNVLTLTLYKGTTMLATGDADLSAPPYDAGLYNALQLRIAGTAVSGRLLGVEVVAATTSTTASDRGVAWGCSRPSTATTGSASPRYFRVLGKYGDPDWTTLSAVDDFSTYATGELLEDTGPWNVGTGPGLLALGDADTLLGLLAGNRDDNADGPSEGGVAADDGAAYLELVPDSTNNQKTLAFYTADRTPADNFEIRATVTPPSGDTFFPALGPWLMARINAGTPTDDDGVITAFGVFNGYSEVQADFAIAVGSTIVATGPAGLSAVDATVKIKLRVQGNVVTMLMDDYPVVQANVGGQNTAHRGVGIGGLCVGASARPRIRRLDVYTPGDAGGPFVPGSPGEQVRDVRIVVVAGEDVHVGHIGSLTKIDNVRTTQRKPSLTDINGLVYLVDGESYVKVIDPQGATAETLTATAGDIPESCSIVVNWRSRLVLAGQVDAPQNIFMSRAGSPRDFDYAPATPDAVQAVALNASEAGRIGQPVVALIPFRDDVLVIGCDHSIYALTGDPAAGGTLDAVSEAVGILTRDSWCLAPDGTIYFVGTGGFYRMAPGGSPEDLSTGKVRSYFRDINRRDNYVMVAWDRDRGGCWIFIQPRVQGAAATNFWFDLRQLAFWPMKFPAEHGPLAVLVYDADAPDDRQLMMGGHDGYVRRFDIEADQDDGVAIESFVVLGPVNPGGPFDKAKLIEMEWTTGVPTNNVNYELRAGQDAAAALAAVADFSGTFTTGGRQDKVRSRARGNTFVLRVGNATISKAWTLERVAGVFDVGGRQR